jgi:TetR/AcrR family transcriptional repressor of nem operon
MKPDPIFANKAFDHPSPAKEKLLNAALSVIRAKGYAATTVDDICRHAGVTKGSFFHHFKSKDDLALATVAHWRALTEHLFANAPYHAAPDPLDRLLGYLDYRNLILTGDLPTYTCLLGTLVQETYDTHPAIREACHQALASHVAELTRDVDAARALHAPHATWSAQSVGDLIQSTLQGSFIFAKAQQSPEVVRENLAHLRRYLRLLFRSSEPDPQTIHQIQAQEEEIHDARTHYTD